MMTKEQIAEVCHEANRALCKANREEAFAWSEAPENQRSSAVAGVEYMLKYPSVPDSAQHDAWMAHKAADGWRYGPVKSVEEKTHPCMVPYEELPPEQRVKDALFRAVVTALAPLL